MDSTLRTTLLLIPALPLAAAVVTAICGARLLGRFSHVPIVLAIALSCACSLRLVGLVAERQHDQESFEAVVTLWNWADLNAAFQQPASTSDASSAAAAAGGLRDFRIDVTLRADALTAMMLAMVTFISTLVAVFASSYMTGDRGYWRFFTYIGLFVFSMTMLVSVSNFVLLFVFWEAVGVCSYLLIGFWYQKPEAAAAGKKAFLVNRIGDFGFALALFLIWTTYGTLDFHDRSAAEPSDDRTSVAVGAAASPAPAVIAAAYRAPDEAGSTDGDSAEPDVAAPAPVASPAPRGVLSPSRIAARDYRTGGIGLAICLLLMLGACGKSAQFPLHVWLPDAMEGPTPVSALIHAATMVTAGVYMVTRCTPLFMASPDAQLVVSVIGAFTALLAGLIALTQHDLKRVLAYSTVSQLGYMFLALGSGSRAGIIAGMFHLFTHAFFKALLFLGSGSVMHAMGNVIDMRRFGGLRRLMPVTHATFLVGCLALAGAPPLSGFWSKDAILGAVHDKAHGLLEAAETSVTAVERGELQLRAQAYQGLYYVGLAVALMTAFYTFRAFCRTFYGEEKIPHEAGHHAHESPPAMTVPLIVLAVCAAVIGGYFEWTHGFAHFLLGVPSLASGAVADTIGPGTLHLDVAGQSTLVAAAGILLAMYLYLGDSREVVWLTGIMNLQGLSKLLSPDSLQKVRRLPPVALFERVLRGCKLGWFADLIGYAAAVAALILTAPLLVGVYVSPYRLSYRKFYWDEIYAVCVVWPLRGIAQAAYWIDRWVIDGAVNFCGRVPLFTGDLMRSLQTGLVPFYALAMVLGAVLLLAARLLWSV